MSLTSFFKKNQDVRQRFRQEFPKPKFSVKKNIVAPPLSNRYGLVGTAFDYLLRFYLQRLNPNTIDKGYWIAEIAVDRLAGYPRLHKKGQKITKKAKKTLAKFLKTGRINEEIIKSTLLLAQLDPIYRAGVGHENIGIIHDEDLNDLQNLISNVEPSLFKAKEQCLVNPTFGYASSMVRGADADLVIDDTIIEIKSTKKLELSGQMFHQLIGYYILHQIGGVGEIEPKLEINKVAVYFSRYAYLQSYEVKDVINQKTLPDFIEWFEKRAYEEYDSTNKSD